MFCISYCSHGGVCILSPGHEGLHDSNYCQWSDAEALSRDEANRMIAENPRTTQFEKDLILATDEVVNALFGGE